jgi:hypothetical protein
VTEVPESLLLGDAEIELEISAFRETYQRILCRNAFFPFASPLKAFR